MASAKDLRILLVGHTGHGKSATGNTLLGQEEFIHGMMHQSVTKTAKRKVAHRFGRKIEVVDTPGFYDTSNDDSYVYKELIKCIALTIPGFNAICFVMKPERFSDEIVKTVDMFFNFFGEGVDEFAFVVLTHIDDEDTKNEYLGPDLTNMHPKLLELTERCKGKLLIVDNNKHIKQNEKETMAKKIINKIDEENSKRSKPYFVNEMINEMDKIARQLIEEQKLHGGNLSDPENKSYMNAFRKMLGKDKSPGTVQQYQSVPTRNPPTQASSSTTDYAEQFKQKVDDDDSFLGAVVDVLKTIFATPLKKFWNWLTG